jgi:hypothetical protein
MFPKFKENERETAVNAQSTNNGYPIAHSFTIYRKKL